MRSILLVESGSRHIVEHVIRLLRRSYGSSVRVDLVSCYGSLPRGFDAATSRVYRVADYQGQASRRKLYGELRGNGYSILGIVCSGEPLMTKWKAALAVQIPAKVFAINENGDYFWLDRTHLDPIRQFVLLRAGLAGAGAVRTLARAFLFPFTLFYLLVYAAAVHARRAARGG